MSIDDVEGQERIRPGDMTTGRFGDYEQYSKSGKVELISRVSVMSDL